MYALTFEEALRIFADGGLGPEQVASSRSAHGSNTVTPPAREPLSLQYLKKFNDPIIRILLLAAGISAAVAVLNRTGILDTLGIIAAILLATTLSFVSEYRSGREFDVLNAHRDEMPVKVFRNAGALTVPAREIVVGDVVLLEAGDAVPADGWVVDADLLAADESAFSGENEPVVKEKRGRVLKGSFVTAGRGTIVAGAVGDAAEIGVIAASLGIDHTTQTPLEGKLTDLARLISRFGYVMAGLILAVLLLHGVMSGEVSRADYGTFSSLLGYFMLAVVIIVVAVPEGLPMSVALSLSLAMRRMTRANCLVRRMIACETIGSATTICTDKTGTLTRNQMEVVVSSTGDPEVPRGIPQTPAEWVTLNAAANSTAHLGERDGRMVTVGNFTEGALLRCAFERVGESILALDDVSFTVEQGEALGIIGRNGAGKSTLLKILSRVTAPTSGVVKVKGRIGSLLEVGTGFHPELTGRENVYLNGAILGMKKAEVARKFDEIVDFSGVEKFIDTPVKRYSSGMYVRLAFAVAAHLDPEILVVDEVLAVGDAEFQKKCLGKMGDVSNKEGRTVLFVSHNLPSIRELCNKCILLEGGKLILTDMTANVISEYLKGTKENLEIIKESDHLKFIGLMNNRSNLNLTIASDIELIMHFQTHSFDLDSVFFDLELYNERFERVIHTKTKFIHNGFSLKKNSHHNLTFKLENPRLAPGKYTLSIYAYSDLGVLLWIKGIDAVEVTSKDPTGRLIAFDRVIAAIIPKFTLELNESK